MKQDKAIEVFNTLIKINNNRIEGYETASKETTDADLKSLFFHLGQATLKCKRELIYEIRKMGGEPLEGDGTISNTFSKVWNDVKGAFTKNDRVSILNSCEYDENVAVDAYYEALNNNLEFLGAEQQALLNKQYLSISSGLSKIKDLRESLVEVPGALTHKL